MVNIKDAGTADGAGTEEVKEVKEVELVKGIDLDVQKKATKLVVAGSADGKSEDEMKQAIFGLGVPFSKLSRLYNAVLKAEGLAVDVAAVKKEIDGLIEKTKFSYAESFGDLVRFADTVVENVKNATAPRVMGQLKAAWKLNETEFPRKPAPVRGRIGAVNKVLIDTFKANPKTSKAELSAALASATKNPDQYANSFHTMCYALANGLTALEVLTVQAKSE